MNLENKKHDKSIYIFVFLILLVQVIISFVIVNKINNLDKTLAEYVRNTESVYPVAMNELPEEPVYVANVATDEDPQKGPQNASVVIVEFSDYQCPACTQAESIVNKLLVDYEDQILFVYRDFPLDHIHPDAFLAAEAANCAGEQGFYWQMHDALFANQTQLDETSLKAHAASLGLNTQEFSTCLDVGRYTDEVQHDIEQGKEYQVNATPTFFVNGYRVVGAREAQLRQLIEDELSKE